MMGNINSIMDIRIGQGIDVHRFAAPAPNSTIILFGVPIPHTQALIGHSDADVGLHAITDALYGALAHGDIGHHFPPTDPQWHNTNSRVFLDHALLYCRDQGYQISNIDCTVVCEAPRINPHRSAIQTHLSNALSIALDRISIKATTSERMGFIGRGEGIAVFATALLITP